MPQVFSKGQGMTRRVSDLQRYRASGDDENFEDLLAFQMKAAGLPSFATQYPWPKIEKAEGRLYPQSPTGRVRGYTADFYFPPMGQKSALLIEVDGQVWFKGGHTSGTGYSEDRVRDAEAMCCGYRTLRVTTGHVTSGQALQWIVRLLGVK